MEILSIIFSFISINILVILHELGHFLVALSRGIIPSSFNVGFGPSLYSITSHQIEYHIRSFPMGGFVGFAPDVLEEASKKDRILIMMAGSATNLIASFCIYLAMYFVGVQCDLHRVTTALGGHIPEELIEQNVRPLDRVVSLDGITLDSVYQMLNMVYSNNKDKAELLLRKPKQRSTFKVVGSSDIFRQLSPAWHMVLEVDGNTYGLIAINGFPATSPFPVSGMLHDSGAPTARFVPIGVLRGEVKTIVWCIAEKDVETGEWYMPLNISDDLMILKDHRDNERMSLLEQEYRCNLTLDAHMLYQGDRIVSLYGSNVDTLDDLMNSLQQDISYALLMKLEGGYSYDRAYMYVDDNGVELYQSLTGYLLDVGGDLPHMYVLKVPNRLVMKRGGLCYDVGDFGYEVGDLQVEVALPPITTFMGVVANTLEGMMVFLSKGVGYASGVIGITKGLAQMLDAGEISSYIMGLAASSIALGIFNLMPVPMLDGGVWLWIILEGLLGKTRGRNIYEWLSRFSSIVLLLAILYIAYSDISAY